jgi:imidazolonepropionase-like amidohydrolase
VSAQELLAIKGGKVIPVVGDPIENGVILIRDGRIDKVGADIKIPIEAKVIDATGKVVMPGIVEVHTSSAMSQSNETNPNVPFLSVIDSVDPAREFFEESRRNGVTTAAVVPGNSTMIGGQAAVIKTAGTYVNDMVLKRKAGLKISVAPTGSTSRMSHYARLRKELETVRDAEKKKAEEKEKKKADEEKPEDKPKPDEKAVQQDDDKKKSPTASSTNAQKPTDDAKMEALTSLLNGDMPAFIYCSTAMDVTQAMRLVEEFKIKPILVLSRDTYKAADAIAKAKVPVILDSTLVYWRTDPRTRDDEKIVLPRLFRDKGIQFSFQVDNSTSRLAMGSHYHWYQAATAVKYGMPVNDALKAITLDAAKLIGVDDFVGSIEPGKDADIVILTGDPLKVTTWVETTIVNGKVVYERDKDVKLKKLLNPKEDEK